MSLPRRRPSRRRVAHSLLRSAAVTVVLLGFGLDGSTPDATTNAGQDPAPGDLSDARPASASTGRFWVSSPVDEDRRLARVAPHAGPPTDVIDVDPSQRRQRWWGTGAALTDASVELLRDRPDALAQLYGPTNATGARLNLLRLPLTATDFSPSLWTWGWDGMAASPSPQARAAVRLLKGPIRGLQPRLRVVGAPWTAPELMKSTGSVRGGGLLGDQVGEYGALLAAQATWLQQHDVPLWAMTLANEPGYSTDYPSMTLTDDQLAELGRTVGPVLRDKGVHLWAVDHNWSDRPRYDASLRDAPGGFDGAAFHCYGGSPDQMAELGVPRMITECTGTTDGFPGTFGWDARNLVSGAVAAGSSGLMMWNLALDADHGPVDAGSTYGCKSCRGLLTMTPDGIRKEPEFFTLAHLARAATPGARVVASSADPGLSVAAFRNPDGTVGVFGHNGTGSTRLLRIRVEDGPRASYEVQAGELFTYRTR